MLTVSAHTWHIRPQEALVSANDQFLCGRVRIKIFGGILILDGDGLNQVEARTIAEQYVEAIEKHLHGGLTLITSEHFNSLLPCVYQSTFGREDREKVKEALRKARSKLLDTEDVTLRRCYDYIQDAQEDN